MPNVPVNPSASYTVAADEIGAVAYQRVKLNVGISGTTSLDVGATTPLPVTVSGTALVSMVPGVSVTVQDGVSVSAQVSGTVTVNGSVAVVPGVSVVAQ